MDGLLFCDKAHPRVLVTGGLGQTAQPLVPLLLQAGHTVTLYDLPGLPPPGWAVREGVLVEHGDVADATALRDAMANARAVVHLAVDISGSGDAARAFSTNVYGTYNVLECARRAGVRAVVVASSAPVHLAAEVACGAPAAGGCPCSAGADYTYDLTKNIQELEALHFAQTYAMNIMVLRLGHIVDGERKTDLNGTPLAEVDYCRGGWVCRHDVARALARAVEIDFTGFRLGHIIGAHQAAGRYAAATALPGFECRERFGEY